MWHSWCQGLVSDATTLTVGDKYADQLWDPTKSEVQNETRTIQSMYRRLFFPGSPK